MTNLSDKKIVAVLGASPKRERYSNMAIRDLVSHGFDVVPVNPAHKIIEGLAVKSTLADVPFKIDTLTVYVGPGQIGPLIADIVHSRPERVILNPGTESLELIRALEGANIPHVLGCTLVMLRTGTF